MVKEVESIHEKQIQLHDKKEKWIKERNLSNRLQQMQALLDDQDDGESEDTMTVHTTQIMVQAIELRLIRIARMLKELKPDCPNDPRIQDLTNQTLARLEQEFAAEIVPDRFYQRQHVMDRQKLERLLMVYCKDQRLKSHSA